MMSNIVSRVKNLLKDEAFSDEQIEEYTKIVSDRICLRINADILPNVFDSICVDASVKMYRRCFYEGISSEGAGSISTSFVDDVLSEYIDEIEGWKENHANSCGSGRVVKFI